MVRCLYKKYLIRKELGFHTDQFETAVASIGKLALETLFTGNPLLQRSDVIQKVGPDVFDYGLLIGHEEAYMLIRDETADIFVTFPHRSLQEFLGAFSFIWLLNKGEEIQSLLGNNCKKPIFLTNPLFLQFCLWFLWDDQTSFNFENRHKVYQCLLQLSLDLMNFPELDMNTHSVFDNSSSGIKMDKLRIRFLADIIVKCNKTSKLVLPYYDGDALDKILGLFNPILNAITCIDIWDIMYHVISFKDAEMVLKAEDNISNHVDIILKHYRTKKNEPAVHLDLGGDVYSTNNVSYHKAKMLYVRSLSSGGQSVENTIKYSPQLKHLCFDFLMKKQTVRMISQVAEAAKIGNLLHLSHLSIFDCEEIKGKVQLLFNSAWPHLKDLNLLRTRLSAADFEFLSLSCKGPEKTLPNLTSLRITVAGEKKEKCWAKLFGLPWLNLKKLHVNSKFEKGSYRLFEVIKDNKLIGLTSLIIETDEHTVIESFCLDQLPNLQSLFFINCLPRAELQKAKITSVLSELGIYCRGFRGNLSSLICKNFQLMTTLILRNTILNSKDLNILNPAKEKNMLPILKYLDISGYEHRGSNKLSLSEFMSLFHGSCTWNELLTLDIRWVFDSSEDDRVIEYMNEIVSRGYLPSLQKLRINRFENKNTHWNRLEKLMLNYCEDYALRNIADAVFWEYLTSA